VLPKAAVTASGESLCGSPVPVKGLACQRILQCNPQPEPLVALFPARHGNCFIIYVFLTICHSRQASAVCSCEIGSADVTSDWGVSAEHFVRRSQAGGKRPEREKAPAFLFQMRRAHSKFFHIAVVM
jgi:hypothetical protein